MDQYQKNRETILKINEETVGLIHQAEAVLRKSAGVFQQWQISCANISKSLIDHVMRIAVVGAIKSGKSTLVNALLQEDYLKRGAGVVTSIVTRIRRGDNLQARLYFKSWDEINNEIEQALVLFPSEQWRNTQERFDIRRSKDRTELTDALDALDAELHVVKDGLNANSILLFSYLKGFEQVHKIVHDESAESHVQEFEAARFQDHRLFVGEDRLAVYLKDIQLDITSETLDSNLEVADCQGSDSPNPLHMAMIQDYLLKAHLIIYVVSSRTGLRQADIRFLTIIKQMGLANNMLFVCNCDIDEHESLADLKFLVQKVSDELALILPDARLFVFSALHHLFHGRADRLPERERARLLQWDHSKDIVSYSNSEFLRLKSSLMRILTQQRSALLLHNQIERIGIVLTGLLNWIKLNKNLLQRDAGEAQQLVERIQSHQGTMRQVQSMISGTLDGGILQINKELKKEIDRFFDRSGGPVLSQLIGYIRNYEIDLNKFRESVMNVGFTQVLYLVFQEFKQAVDTYMAEKINPDIMGFMGRLEFRLKDYFESMIEPYETMVRDTLSQYEGALAQFGWDQMPEKTGFDTVPDLSRIKESMGLSLPPAAATLRYSTHIKTDAVMRLGIYALFRALRKIMKKSTGAKGDEELRALKDAVRRMKHETERSILEHFRDYQENIKFQYIVRLADEAGKRLFEGLTGHFRIYVSELKTLIDSMSSERIDKQEVVETLGELTTSIRALQSRIDGVRCDVDHMRESQVATQMPLNVASSQD